MSLIISIHAGIRDFHRVRGNDFFEPKMLVENCEMLRQNPSRLLTY